MSFSKPPRPKLVPPPGADAFISGAETATIRPDDESAGALPAPPPKPTSGADVATDDESASPPPAPPTKPTRSRSSRVSTPSSPAEDDELEVTSQTVRLTVRQKEALQRLAKHEDRSEQKIIARLLGPALLAAAAKIDEN